MTVREQDQPDNHSKSAQLSNSQTSCAQAAHRPLGLWHVGVFFKGMAMGAADVVPGVSGGTIAFITGIYTLLITSIQKCSHGGLLLLFRGRFREFWLHINGTFLVVLAIGILSSILILARAIHHLLETVPQLLWGFFFGLIIASSFLLARHLPRRGVRELVACMLGVVVAAAISFATPSVMTPAPLLIVGAGMVAICAMILPGISGSFLLLLMGFYEVIIGAIKSLDVGILALFAGGCAIGLLAFSHVVAYFLTRFESITLATLTGFMLGALVKVWPWQHTTRWRVNSKGESVPFTQEPVLPQSFADLTGEPSMTVGVLGCMLLGLALVAAFEIFSRQKAAP
jgi:putative membrane protein